MVSWMNVDPSIDEHRFQQIIEDNISEITIKKPVKENKKCIQGLGILDLTVRSSFTACTVYNLYPPYGTLPPDGMHLSSTVSTPPRKPFMERLVSGYKQSLLPSSAKSLVR